jgi:hypothetical protein
MGERVVICGHGASRPHVSAYTTVPKGCTISFYTEYAKTLAGTDGPMIAGDTLGRAATSTLGEFKTCPNLMYFPLSASEKLGFENAKAASTILTFCDQAAGYSLEQLFTGWSASGRKFDFHWGCCQALQLKNSGTSASIAAGGSYDASKLVGSSKTGINLVEQGDGFYQYDYTAASYVKVANK